MVMPAFNHEVHLKDNELHDSILPSTNQDALQMVDKYKFTPFHVSIFFPGPPTVLPTLTSGTVKSLTALGILLGMS
jgi:hypothetical protein